MPEREEFLALLHEFRQKNATTPISNRYPWQSKMATVELLKLAKSVPSEIRVLTGSGHESFYAGDVEDAFRSALRQKCSAKVLVWTDAQHPYGEVLNRVKREFPQNMQVRISGTIAKSEGVPHFLTVGKQAYRLEKAHPRLEGPLVDDETPETVAEICFNGEDTATALCTFFDTIWRHLDKREEKFPSPAPEVSP